MSSGYNTEIKKELQNVNNYIDLKEERNKEIKIEQYKEPIEKPKIVINKEVVSGKNKKIIKIINGQNKQIENIISQKENNFNKILSCIKSKFIIKRIFSNLDTKRKLYFIRYNKKMQFELNINKNDYIEYILNDINQKYELNLKDFNTNHLFISKPIKKEDLEYLFKINWKQLKAIYFKDNNLSEINTFNKINSKELRELSLTKNKISDINIFGELNFQRLKLLYLNDNIISNINIFEK